MPDGLLLAWPVLVTCSGAAGEAGQVPAPGEEGPQEEVRRY